MQNTVREIEKYKAEKKAVILAHSYTRPEIQDIADYVGDSYGLSKRAAEEKNAEIILFAGVRFMAETAKLLAPDKKVLLPVPDAGCPMADMIDTYILTEWQRKYPDAATVCYVNSTAAVKAVSDVCVTSSNAVKIVKSLPHSRILFIPDANLGSYVADQLPEKEVILYNGNCPVHHEVTMEEVMAAKEKHPGVPVLMHPECRKEVRALADHIFSTGQMQQYVAQKKFGQYIIVTEGGLIHTLRKEDPEARFYELSPRSLYCVNMKKIMLSDILRSLKEEIESISINSSIAASARSSLQKMLELAGA